MSNWLVHDENVIVNAIVAESKKDAEEVTGLKAFLANEEAKPWIGWIKYGDSWIPPMPKTNGPWIWNEEIQSWETPSE